MTDTTPDIAALADGKHANRVLRPNGGPWDVMRLLERGPKTVAEIVAATGRRSGAVSRDCIYLIQLGRIVRLNPKTGRGHRQRYALRAHLEARAEGREV